MQREAHSNSITRRDLYSASLGALLAVSGAISVDIFLTRAETRRLIAETAKAIEERDAAAANVSETMNELKEELQKNDEIMAAIKKKEKEIAELKPIAEKWAKIFLSLEEEFKKMMSDPSVDNIEAYMKCEKIQNEWKKLIPQLMAEDQATHDLFKETTNTGEARNVQLPENASSRQKLYFDAMRRISYNLEIIEGYAIVLEKSPNILVDRMKDKQPESGQK